MSLITFIHFILILFYCTKQKKWMKWSFIFIISNIIMDAFHPILILILIPLYSTKCNISRSQRWVQFCTNWTSFIFKELSVLLPHHLHSWSIFCTYWCTLKSCRFYCRIFVSPSLLVHSCCTHTHTHTHAHFCITWTIFVSPSLLVHSCCIHTHTHTILVARTHTHTHTNYKELLIFLSNHLHPSPFLIISW